MARRVFRLLKLGLSLTFYHLGLIRLLLTLRRSRPIVLRYHRIYRDGERPFYELGVPRSLFERQLDFLRRRFEVVSLARVYDSLFGDGPPLDRAVVLTFDDGYRDNYTEALPALMARGLPALLFVSAGNVDRNRPFWWDRLAVVLGADPSRRVRIHAGSGERWIEPGDVDSRRRQFDTIREELKLMPHARAQAVLDRLEADLGSLGKPPEGLLLSWAEIEEMARGGFDIGSHTLDHVILSRVPRDEAERQIVDSRSLLETRLQRPVRFFSYPNGKPEDVTPEVLSQVRQAGYRGAVSTIKGRPSEGSDPFFLERFDVTVGNSADGTGRFSEALFATELSGLYDLLLFRRARGRRLH